MTSERHTPVLSESVLRFLDPKPGSVIVDCTLNGGGHAALLAAHGAHVLGIEWDPSIASTFYDHHPELRETVTVVNENYTGLERICAERGIVPDGVLFDLGLSSIHYAESGRGFSFNQTDEPLDMRYNPQSTAVTAGRLINESEPAELERILREYGEEQFAGQIAAAVAIARRTAPFRTVGDLVQTIEASVPPWYRRQRIHCATKTFQALRVAVNDELGNVTAGVSAAIRVLKPGGHLVVIAFQGSEDKIVRELFKKSAKEGTIRWVTRDTIRPTWQEMKSNPRSRSAKLKVIEKLP